MRKRKLFAILLLCAALLTVSAFAENYVSGSIEGNALRVQWKIPKGSGELTVYQNDWPLCVRKVEGGEGTLSVALDNPSAQYRLRLKSQKGTWTASVTGSKAAQRAASTASSAKTPAVSNQQSLANRVVELVNEARAAQGMKALRMDSALTQAACVRAGELTQKFSHTRPDGSKWKTVSSKAYAENIARGQNTADKVVAAWLSSSTGHRENILHASYGSIGVCAYKYNGVMYWVQLFGK